MSKIEQASKLIHEIRQNDMLMKDPEHDVTSWEDYSNDEFKRHSVYARTLALKYKLEVIQRKGLDIGVIKTDKFGRITAKKTGTATIAAYCGKTKLEGSEISIRVRTPIKLFKLSKDYIKVKSGSSNQKSVSLAVKTNPAYKVLKEEGSYIKWSVPAGYTIKDGSDQNGKVTYIFPAGVADRTATAVIYDAVTGVTYTATVTIDMQ